VRGKKDRPKRKPEEESIEPSQKAVNNKKRNSRPKTWEKKSRLSSSQERSTLSGEGNLAFRMSEETKIKERGAMTEKHSRKGGP